VVVSFGEFLAFSMVLVVPSGVPVFHVFVLVLFLLVFIGVSLVFTHLFPVVALLFLFMVIRRSLG
jgi:hypothetical protein